MTVTAKRPALKIALALLGAVLLVVIAYLLYVILTYSRIEDNLPLEIEGEAISDELTLGTEYTIVTQNLGFGAYTSDFTFFMDGGKESRAARSSLYSTSTAQPTAAVPRYVPHR